jgi:hypothetical protein
LGLHFIAYGLINLVVSGNNRQDKNQDTDDTNEHNNQFPKQGYTHSHYRESENVKPIFLKDVDSPHLAHTLNPLYTLGLRFIAYGLINFDIC